MVKNKYKHNTGIFICKRFNEKRCKVINLVYQLWYLTIELHTSVS